MDYNYPTPLDKLFNVYHSKGFVIYIVGGAVRDLIIGDKPSDYDLVTDAKPDETIKILEELNCKVHRQGERFGVIGSTLDTLKIEITTFRKDVDAVRDTNVEFNVTIEEDAGRRDIPYNALYFDPKTKKILDFNNGVEDLKNKITRLIGDPVKRLSEDKLRVLRVLRYACKYNHTIEKNTIVALKNAELEGVSKERIYNEITLAYHNGNFDLYLHYLKEFNLFKHVFPGLEVNYNKMLNSKHFVIYLANIFRTNEPDSIEPILEELKYDRKTIHNIKFLLNMLEVDPLKISIYLKDRKQINLDDTILNEWCTVMSLGDLERKSITYKTIITGNVVEKLITQGFYGKELTNKLNEIEYNNFINTN